MQRPALPAPYTLRTILTARATLSLNEFTTMQALSHAVTKGVTTASGAQTRTPQRAGVLLTRRTRVAHLPERPGHTPTRQRVDTAHFTHRALTQRPHSRRTAQHCTARMRTHLSRALRTDSDQSRVARASAAQNSFILKI